MKSCGRGKVSSQTRAAFPASHQPASHGVAPWLVATPTVGFLHAALSGFCILESLRGTHMRKDSLQTRIANRIARSKRDVYLTSDFSGMSGEDQIIRALRALVAERKLLRLGKGVYAKARPSQLSGRAVLANPGGFQVVAQQALTRLGVEWSPTEAQRAFAENRSTQIPVNPVVRINGRFARKLSYGSSELVIER